MEAQTETHEQWAVKAPNGAYVRESNPASLMNSVMALLTTDPKKARAFDDRAAATEVARRYAEIAERIGYDEGTFEVVRRRVMVVFPEFEAAPAQAEPEEPF